MKYQQISNQLTTDVWSIDNLLVKKKLIFFLYLKFQNYHMENTNVMFILVEGKLIVWVGELFKDQKFRGAFRDL